MHFNHHFDVVEDGGPEDDHDSLLNHKILAFKEIPPSLLGEHYAVVNGGAVRDVAHSPSSTKP